jgi:hypothetical protein
VFFAHPAHPLAGMKRLKLPDIAETPLIVREGRGSTEKLLRELKSRGVNVNVRLRCRPTSNRNRNLVCELLIDDIERKDLMVLRFDGMPKVTGHSYIVFSKKKPLSCVAEEFVRLLRSRKHTAHSIF